MSELGRFTIRGEDDVNLLNRVQTKIQEVSDYRDHQVYCSNCNDADGGCVMASSTLKLMLVDVHSSTLILMRIFKIIFFINKLNG